ncbi:type III pantothenate kinase [Gramella sp. AN32]|uniref:Type III pantothenate kinase n=1 Tax=Christiangramia antarctica TaxID=2058158 RepID=A0ABW5X1P6_9FLAO|nr:type III pantothenate kinase [Gramella sp. AN32]MCM4156670.1 type III pantothenate kinase [Gramella sp. AN32]
MNLVVDIGNTLVKTAVFQNNKLLEKRTFSKEKFSKEFDIIQKNYPLITKCIISSVSKDDEKFQNKLKANYKTFFLDDRVKLPFQNGYATPNSLGKDRIAVVAAAVDQYPGKNVLIIDAGTCITYDLKTCEEKYLGGAISPGINLRFKSLHKFTANLPLVTPKPEPGIIGNSTETSILSGVINGIKMELKSTAEWYLSEFEDLTIIFTGGDHQILSMPLKNSIFANSNFLLEGLNFILEFNKTQ